MSQLAPFVDGAKFEDRTGFQETYISYYTWGEALGAALDLTLRDRSDGRITLDDFMRALWDKFGRSASRRAGYVEKPYTAADLKATLAEVSGDAAFASQFFASYVEGREVVDYARLLSRAGLILRQRQGVAGKSGAVSGLEVVLAEEAGQTVTDAQRRFRDAWLNSSARSAF
jgi:predicted metalloprotease with PDZ domain